MSSSAADFAVDSRACQHVFPAGRMSMRLARMSGQNTHGATGAVEGDGATAAVGTVFAMGARDSAGVASGRHSILVSHTVAHTMLSLVSVPTKLLNIRHVAPSPVGSDRSGSAISPPQ